MNSKRAQKWLMGGVLISGLSLPWLAHADATASAVLSDLRFLAVDLDLTDGSDPTYLIEGDLTGHAYLEAGDRFNTRQTNTQQGGLPIDLSIGIGGPAAAAKGTSSSSPGQLSVHASASGNDYHFARGEASLGSPRPGREFRVGIDLAPRSLLVISMLGSVTASAGGLSGCPIVTDDASKFCEEQRGGATVSGSLSYAYQDGSLSVSSNQFDMVSKGVALTPIYDFSPEDLGFFLQIVDPAPDQRVEDHRRMYFTFSNTSSAVQHADLKLYAHAFAGGGIPAVPEPSTGALVALGLCMLGLGRKRLQR